MRRAVKRSAPLQYWNRWPRCSLLGLNELIGEARHDCCEKLIKLTPLLSGAKTMRDGHSPCNCCFVTGREVNHCIMTVMWNLFPFTSNFVCTAFSPYKPWTACARHLCNMPYVSDTWKPCKNCLALHFSVSNELRKILLPLHLSGVSGGHFNASALPGGGADVHALKTPTIPRQRPRSAYLFPRKFNLFELYFVNVTLA